MCRQRWPSCAKRSVISAWPGAARHVPIGPRWLRKGPAGAASKLSIRLVAAPDWASTHRWGAVIMGFVGVLIITQPGAGMAGWGIATGLIGALLSAGVSILLRQIGKTEGAATTVFWFSALSVPPTAIAFAITASPHPAQTWLLLALVGMCGGIAQMLMTASLKLGPVSLVVPMDYTGLVWATLFGWVLFDVLPGWSTWLGAPFVIGSGLYIVWREHVRRRGETTQAIA